MSASPFSPLSPTTSAPVVPLPRAASSVTISDSASTSDPVVLAQLNDQRRRIDDLQRQFDVKSEAGRAERACHTRELESLRSHLSTCENRFDARCAVQDDAWTAKLRQAAEAAAGQATLQRETQEALTAELQRIELERQQQQQGFANQLSAMRAIIGQQQEQQRDTANQIIALKTIIEAQRQQQLDTEKQISELKATIEQQQPQSQPSTSTAAVPSGGSADLDGLRTCMLSMAEAATAAVTRLTVVPTSISVDSAAAALVPPPILGSSPLSPLQTQVGRLVTAVQALQSPQPTLHTQYMGNSVCTFPASPKDHCVRFSLVKKLPLSHFIISATLSLVPVADTCGRVDAVWCWAAGTAKGGATSSGQPLLLDDPRSCSHGQLVVLLPSDQTARSAEVTLRLDSKTLISIEAGSVKAAFFCMCSVREVPGLPAGAARAGTSSSSASAISAGSGSAAAGAAGAAGGAGRKPASAK